MHKFKNRLKYYLIGFGLGLVFMFFIFGNRACAWLPENRVKNMLAEKEIFVGDSVQYLMQCQNVTNDDVYRLLNEEGDVDFERSITDVHPKIYLFQGYKDKKDITITYALGDSTTEVIGFEFGGNTCTTVLSNEHKNVVSVPEFKIISIIEEQKIRILDRAQCQMDAHGLTNAEVLNFHLHATNVVEMSEPRLEPNPFYWMHGMIQNVDFEIKYIIGDSRTRIAEIIGPVETDCE
ncbi:MAG: hypothetical protein BM555_02095 [Crocinitomix sp. MedPE-SWsnd]|nr:MAG: hypothetical protein BM555_02095 [Crocinitomix sp. MedPE-SWsnd]